MIDLSSHFLQLRYGHRKLHQGCARKTARLHCDIVLQTDGFSFAYLKELFLSSMMQWMSVGSGSEGSGGDAGSGKSMDEIVLHQAKQLKAQMSGSATSSKAARA